MSQRLFDDSDDDGIEDLKLGTNEGYAKSYNSFRKKELLKKYKDRGYDVEESDLSNDSDSSSSEDEIDPKFDEKFFKTLASLKSKDPSIYDKNTRFFENVDDEKNDENDDDGVKKTKKSKPVTIKDYERQIILEKDGKFEDDTDEEVVDGKEQRSASPTVVEEERRLKAEFKKVLNADDSEDEEFGGIFKKREKTREEKAQDDADFTKWLAGKQADIEKEHKQKLQPLKNYWSNQNLPQSERFLRDYILNQGYADANAADIPTYDEIVGDNMPLSEDEQELEKQAEFEHKYNFRFEEPDAEFIQRYPRTIENSVRRTDDKRKQKRQEVKQRKQQEKEQKMKEFEMIKEMKRKEVEEKIRKLKAVTGNDELGFKDEELDEDFDPDAHDRRMQELFNDDYYEVDEGEDKPECPSDIDELKVEDWDNYDPQNERSSSSSTPYDYEPHCEDDDFNMDCDYDPASSKQELQKELIDNTKGRRGRRGRRNRFMEMIQAEKPAFNPDDEKTYGDYIDEYYQMDCEDVIGDVPCRFKYVETTPNDFGLTIEEILLAKNRELNQWASLKKAIQIRPQQVEKKEQRLYKMKAHNEDLKRKIFKSIYGNESDDEKVEDNSTDKNSVVVQNANDVNSSGSSEKKSKKKRKRKTQTNQVFLNGNENSHHEDNNVHVEEVSAKKAKVDNSTDVGQLKEISTTKPQENKMKKKKKNVQSTGLTNVLSNSTSIEENPEGKIKDKNSINTQSLNNIKSTAQKMGKNETVMTKNAKQNNKNPFNKLQSSGVTAANINTDKEKKNVIATNSNSSNPFNKTPKQIPIERAAPRRSFGGRKTFGAQSTLKSKFKPKFTSKQNRINGKSKNGNDGKITDDRLKAYGINPRKFHKREKYGNKEK